MHLGSLPLGASLHKVLNQIFILLAKQCPGLIWRLERDCASGSEFKKICTALKRDYISPQTIQPVCNQPTPVNISRPIVCDATHCFQFLSQATASHTYVSQ